MSGDDDSLRAVVRRLALLIRKDREYWTEGIRRWAADPPLHGDHGVVPIPLPVTLFLDEKTALLAAIHDACVTDAARINPWRDPRDMPKLTEESVNAIPVEYQLAIRYDILIKDRVPKLRERWDTHEAAIELFIAEAEEALAKVQPVGSTREAGRIDDRLEDQDVEGRPVETLDAIHPLLAAFVNAAAQYPTALRVVAFKNAAHENGLTTVPKSFIPGVNTGKFTIGGDSKAVLGPQTILYGVGGARVLIDEHDENVGFVLYGPSEEDDAVVRLRELGRKAGVAAHAYDLAPGIQAYDSPFVLWVLLIYATLRGSNWIQQIESVPETPTEHFNPFTASIETLKRLAARFAKTRKVTNDQTSPYTLKSLIQFLANLTMREQSARELPPSDGVEPSHDPALQILVRAQKSRQQLEALPEVQRLKVHMPSGYNFDAEGLSEWVKAVCRAKDLSLDEVGAMSLDEFSNLAEKSRPQATEQSRSQDHSHTDWISFSELAKLLGHTSKKRLQNEVAEWRKEGHTIDDPCSYAAVRPLILSSWKSKAKMFPETLAEAKVILKNLA